jgi:hypothetical protein
MTLAEFRAQQDRRATEEAKRAWVQEVSDPTACPGMMRFTVYECGEPGLGVIIDRYLDLELIYDQRADRLHDAEISRCIVPIGGGVDIWAEALHKDPVLPRMAAALERESII